MEDPKPLREKLYRLLIAAACGCIIFAAATVAIFFGAHLWMHGRKGDLWVDFFFGLLFIVGAPAAAFQDLAGLGTAPADSFISGRAFCVILNTVLGAFIFAAVAALWEFGVKWYLKAWRENENH